MNQISIIFTIILAAATLLSGCMSTTSAPTEVTSEGVGTISDITSDIASSTTPDSSESDEEHAKAFLRRHRERITRDMAMGGGEHLAALAVLLKVPAEKHATFFLASRRHFTHIFTSDQVAEAELLHRINRLCIIDQALSPAS